MAIRIAYVYSEGMDCTDGSDVRGWSEVVAVFVDPLYDAARILTLGAADRLTCYAHCGQHSECDVHWYRVAKPATPEQYAALHAELSRIYAPETLTIVQKQQWTLVD